MAHPASSIIHGGGFQGGGGWGRGGSHTLKIEALFHPPRPSFGKKNVTAVQLTGDFNLITVRLLLHPCSGFRMTEQFFLLGDITFKVSCVFVCLLCYRMKERLL